MDKKELEIRKKTPIWEEDAYRPYDKTFRNYNKSSYSYDMAAVEKAKKAGRLWEVDIKDIEVGQKYKYKELCDLMREQYFKTSKHQQDAQMRVWRCFFDFEKVFDRGRAFYFVKEKYSSPKYELYLSRDSENELRGDYSKYIYQILLMCLYRPERENDGNDFYEFRTTKWNLFKVLGFANELFFQNYAFPGEYEIVDVRDDNCYKRYKKGSLQLQFYRDALAKFNDTLNKALYSLHQCKKINYYYDLHIKVNGKWKRADRVENSNVTQVEGEVLARFDCESFPEAAFRGKTKEYRKMVKEELRNRYGIENYYDEIDVWVIKCNVKTGIIRMYERYTGRNVENELGLTPTQLCQKENAENLNKLIQKYFYELNAPKRARQNSEWYIEEHKKDENVSEKKRQEYYERALFKQSELIHKYIELNDYLGLLLNGPKAIVEPEDIWLEEAQIVKEINRDENRTLYGEDPKIIQNDSTEEDEWGI